MAAVWMILLLTVLVCIPQLGLNVVAQSCTATSLCDNNLCCSQYNYCGSTSDYCGAGCLSGPCTGSGSGSCSASSPCANNLCCSQYGYCGTGSDYCGAGCLGGPCTGSGSGTCSASSPCASNQCCSQYNYCGTTSDYCGAGCLSGPCTGSGSGAGVGSIITEAVYNQFFLHTSDCSTNNFYTYSSFITAADSFGAFGRTGDDTTRRQELAAFFAQVSHETTGGYPGAPDGQYSWGLCYITEISCSTYCDSSSTTYPCASGKSYCGRGPIQLSWNYNYGQAGNALGQNLLNNPDLVATNNVVSWQTALWFWNTAQSPKPSAHSVMVGQWSPSSADYAANRLPGFGVTTNIINGGLECGPNGNPASVQGRIGFYQRYCSILGVSTGSNVDCSNQTPW